MNKKERIMKATLKELSEKGFEKSRLQDIADKAGVGKGTLYLYFKDKEELYISSMEYLMQQWYANAQKVIDKETDAETKINEYFDVTLKGIVKNRSFAKIIMREMPSFLLKVKTRDDHGPIKMYKLRSSQIAEVIEQGKREGAFMDMDTEIAAGIVIGSLNTFMMQYIIFSDKFTEEIFNKYKYVIINMLKKGEQ